MTTTIPGNQSPGGANALTTSSRKPQVPGLYGKRAYAAWQATDRKDFEAFQNARSPEAKEAARNVIRNRNLRYAPERTLPNSQALYDNAFGYAERDIFHRDNNFDGALDLADLSDAYIGPNGYEPQAMEKATHELLIKDRNGDRRIDGVENAAFVLLTDNITEAVVKRYHEIMADPIQRAIHLKENAGESLRQTLERIRTQMPSKFDGQLSYHERFLAHFFTRLGASTGAIIGELLDQTIAQHKLPERYKDFKAREKAYVDQYVGNPNYTLKVSPTEGPSRTPPFS